MENVVSILMKRDRISKKEAEAMVSECKSRLEQEAVATGDYESAVDIIAEELGLEPDYMPELLSGFSKKGGDSMNTELMRANRVAVKADGENFVADFYRTHKPVGSIHSENTDWKAPADAVNKTTVRESFRQWAIENCKDWNINWDPIDRRENARKAKYDSDQALIEDATDIVASEMAVLVDKCKYPIEFEGITHEDIFPLTKTGTGRDLSSMGIIDGKYEKSGNWAWADIKFALTIKYKNEECYMIVTAKLVSGQLKKVGMGITEFNNKVKDEIIGAGLATEDELDPPKDVKKPKKEDKQVEESKEEVKEEPKKTTRKKSTKKEEQETPAEEKPKRRRSRKSKTEE